jgi:hypothetical protein
MRLLKNYSGALLLFIFTSNVFSGDYEAIISPRNADYNILQVSYEGNTLEDLQSQVKDTLDKTLSFENAKLSNLNSKNLTKIEKDRDLIIGVLDTVKSIITIRGLAKNFSTKILSDAQFQQAVKDVVLTILPLLTKELSDQGLIFPDNKDLEGLVGVLVGTIAKVIQSDFSASVTPLDYVSLGLDAAALLTHVAATMDVNNFLYYNLSAPITDAYIRYYADFLTNPKARFINLKIVKLLSLQEFISNRYYRASNSTSTKEILTEYEFKAVSGTFPNSSHSLRNAIRSQSIIMNADDFDSFTDYLLSFPSVLVGTGIDIITVNVEPFIYPKLIQYIDRMVEQRLRLVRLPISGYPVMRLSIRDNFEANSKIIPIGLGVSKSHSISNLSNYSIFEIGTFPLSKTELVCEDFINLTESEVIKLSNYGVFDSTECRGPDNLSFNFTFKNGEEWELFDDFSLENRYVGKSSNASKLIKYITNLKRHNIDFENDVAKIDVNSNISQHEFSELMYRGFDDFKMLYPMDDYEKYYSLLNEYRRPDLWLTYQQFFEILDAYLSAMSPDRNDPFWMKNGARIFPSNNSNLSIYINREKAKAREFDSSNFVKYIVNLSLSGVIKFEPIILKDYLKYMSNLMDLLNIKPGKE